MAQPISVLSKRNILRVHQHSKSPGPSDQSWRDARRAGTRFARHRPEHKCGAARPFRRQHIACLPATQSLPYLTITLTAERPPPGTAVVPPRGGAPSTRVGSRLCRARKRARRDTCRWKLIVALSEVFSGRVVGEAGFRHSLARSNQVVLFDETSTYGPWQRGEGDECGGRCRRALRSACRA